ncbi:MAG TPA: DNA-binding protein [Planctomycetes bacterium]|nr:DNA-binding protein [Planctomycetota bacterium]
MEAVYVETTIFSYLAARPSRDLLIAAHQQTTHDWWSNRRAVFECVISQAVYDEAAAGDADAAARRMVFIKGLPMLEATEDAERLARAILENGAVPMQAARDAAHIAIATVNAVEYLLTWNCTHLANAQIMRKVSAVCNAEGFSMPVICTPEELMGA